MKKYSQGFIPFIPLLIIAVVVAVGGGTYIYTANKTDTRLTTNETANVETETSAKQSIETKKQNSQTKTTKTDTATVKAEIGVKAEVNIPVSNTPKITSIEPATAKIGTTITLHGSGFSTTQNSIHYRKTDDTKTRLITLQASTDGKTLTFVLPSREGISPSASCASYCVQEPITPGTYLISVGKYVQVTAEESNCVFLTVE